MPTDQKSIIMKSLGVDEKTALEIIACDKAIDKGESMPFDLSPDQEKNAKHRGQKMPTVYKHTKRERKEDIQKRELIDKIAEMLGQGEITEIEVTNPERQIDFKVADRKFRVILSAPRS